VAGFEEWTPAIEDSRLAPGRAVRVSVEGTDLFLLRSGERIHAMDDRCSHMGAPLHKGRLNLRGGQPIVMCPLHGSTFWLTDGRVIRGPATRPMTVYDARVNEGMVEIRARGGGDSSGGGGGSSDGGGSGDSADGPGELSG
jgi:nitrite reductase/ring-hydroxylating ferredoxin subunit